MVVTRTWPAPAATSESVARLSTVGRNVTIPTNSQLWRSPRIAAASPPGRRFGRAHPGPAPPVSPLGQGQTGHLIGARAVSGLGLMVGHALCRSTAVRGSPPSSKPHAGSAACTCSCSRPGPPGSTALSNAPTAPTPRSPTRHPCSLEMKKLNRELRHWERTPPALTRQFLQRASSQRTGRVWTSTKTCRAL
jgi:hypothetical protein